MGQHSDRDTISQASIAAKAEGRNVILTNGAFDLLHVGHLRYLQGARALDEAALLVVAVNSDNSVRRAKGQDRPIIPEEERAELVCALKGIDWVFIFDEDTVEQTIKVLRPTIHAKGTDYTADTVPEKLIVEKYGGRVAIVGDPKNHSTTELKKRLTGAG